MEIGLQLIINKENYTAIWIDCSHIQGVILIFKWFLCTGKQLYCVLSG